MKLVAWQLEAALVFLTLGIIAYFGGSKFTDWSAALAVFLGFLHAQVAFDLADYNKSSKINTSPQSNLLKNFYLIKEAIWLVTFVALKSYPLLAGSAIFISYPALRRIIRSKIFAGKPILLQIQLAKIPSLRNSRKWNQSQVLRSLNSL
jgi:hypothetical protein